MEQDIKKEFQKLNKRFDKRFDKVDQRFDASDKRFDTLARFIYKNVAIKQDLQELRLELTETLASKEDNSRVLNAVDAYAK